MPHVFVNRARLYGLSDVAGEFKWEIINTIFYLIGGSILLAGSVLFLPKYEEMQHIGSWCYAVASLFTIFGKCLNRRVNLDNANLLDMVASTSYLVGAICFILGSIFFLPEVGLFRRGAHTFIIGSALFVVGAVVNSKKGRRLFMPILRLFPLLLVPHFTWPGLSHICGT